MNAKFIRKIISPVSFSEVSALLFPKFKIFSTFDLSAILQLQT